MHANCCSVVIVRNSDNFMTLLMVYDKQHAKCFHRFGPLGISKVHNLHNDRAAMSASCIAYAKLHRSFSTEYNVSGLLNDF